MQSKAELRVLVTLREMAIHKQENKTDARPRDLLRVNGDGLIMSAWTQLGIDRFYPYGLHLPQLYQGMERLVAAGLVDKRERDEDTPAQSAPTYVLNAKGVKAAKKLMSDDWKHWPTLEEISR